jgi:hypothetical protein
MRVTERAKALTRKKVKVRLLEADFFPKHKSGANSGYSCESQGNNGNVKEPMYLIKKLLTISL